MKLIHLSDLHIGKRMNEFSMLEDQRYILDQITSIIEKEAPDAVLICGSEGSGRVFDFSGTEKSAGFSDQWKS